MVSSPLQPGHPGPGRSTPPLQARIGSPHPPSKVDIGFLAPLESSGADRKNRLSRSDSPSRGKPLPNVNSNVSPNIRQQTSPNSPHSPLTSSSQRPSGRDPMPMQQKPLPQQSRPPSAAASKPAPASTQKPAPSSGQPAATARPPGKGPKTFEEMGVPAGKGKDDCVSITDLVCEIA